MQEIITGMESEVRIYSRLFPSLFSKARGSFLEDHQGKKYLDFFCGAGSSNYGHNNANMKQAIIDYLNNDGIINSLDQLTQAKYNFMNSFNEIILRPRDLTYKIQFTGPTGTNAVEAALKLARKYTKREKIMYFEHSFHGMSYGSMSVSGMRNGSLSIDYKKNVIEMPFHDHPDSLKRIKDYLESCDVKNLPAAIIVEAIQAEGGVKVASKQWLEEVYALTRKYGMLLIMDEIQTGCGRTGTFFAFEIADVKPDIICLSKSLSGYGLPLSIILLKPEIDCWYPGEHNGTFRGNNLAFITARIALNYWKDSGFSEAIKLKSEKFVTYFNNKNIELIGRGLMLAFVTPNADVNNRLQQRLFEQGLLADTCGCNDNVIKFMPPLTITNEELDEGLHIISDSIESVCN